MLTNLLAQASEFTLIDRITSELAPPAEEIPLTVILARLGCAALVGWVLGLGYRLSFTGKKLKPTMHHTLVMLCIGGALVWLVVGNNLVRAFGLAGTIGLIRYRTTVRDPKDTTVLFFAMILGMAIGLGHYLTAIAGCLFVFVVLVVMRLTHIPPDDPGAWDDYEKKKKKIRTGDDIPPPIEAGPMPDTSPGPAPGPAPDRA